jgi:hypothetical protein
MAIIKLGDFEFSNQNKAKEFVRMRLKDFDPNSPLWMDLVLRHPESVKKIGVGIRRFYVSPNFMAPQHLQLNIERIDGSTEDISWIKCIAGKATSTKARLNQAMRAAIALDIIRFKESSYSPDMPCSLCGTELKSSYHAHADHVLEFAIIAKQFLEMNDPHPQSFDDCAQTHRPIFKDIDVDFKLRWIAYHNQNMNLRLICAPCNLKRNKK